MDYEVKRRNKREEAGIGTDGSRGSIKPFNEEDINISKGLKKISSEDIRRVPK